MYTLAGASKHQCHQCINISMLFALCKQCIPCTMQQAREDSAAPALASFSFAPRSLFVSVFYRTFCVPASAAPTKYIYTYRLSHLSSALPPSQRQPRQPVLTLLLPSSHLNVPSLTLLIPYHNRPTCLPSPLPRTTPRRHRRKTKPPNRSPRSQSTSLQPCTLS